jgi:hypothetical protein
MKPLVLIEWKADNQPIDDDGNLIRITGRQGGLIAWLFSLLKIEPTTSIKVSKDRVEFVSSSLSGTEYRMIPISSVCSTYYGYHKPWKTALAILIFFVFLAFNIGSNLVIFAIFFLAGPAIAFLYYFLNRVWTLGFVEHSGVVSRIRFKRSVIEGVDVNETQGHYICQITQFLIESKRNNL